jgi:hypothetical protein
VSNRGAYDPATVKFLRTVLNGAWDAMAPCHKEQISKSHLAECVLRTRTANVMLFGAGDAISAGFCCFCDEIIAIVRGTPLARCSGKSSAAPPD